jgi:hypothetical protein
MRLPLLVLLLGAALGLSAPARAQNEKPRPLYYEREIGAADLQGRSLRELVLLRNTVYARAGNRFRKQWLADHFAAQPWYRPLPKMDEAKLTALDRKNARAVALFEEALDRKELERRRGEVQARVGKGKAGPEDEVELRLLSQKLGTWVGAEEARRAETRSPLEDPSVLERQISLQQLSDLSRRDLRILRNTIYARRGRPFKSEILQQYFDDMSWYAVDAAYSDKKLTDVDRRNIKLVRSVEDSLGGPLSDRAHREEDGWLFEA